MNFSPICKANFYYITIETGTERHEISKDWIEDLEIYYDVDLPGVVSCSLVISDPINISSLIKYDTTIELYIDDIFENFYIKRFKIFNTYEDKVNNGVKILRMHLIDEFSNYLLKNFKTSGFSNIKLSDILINAYTSALEGNYISELITFNISPTTIIHENIVIPKNENFLKFLYTRLQKEGYRLYHTKNEVILESIKNLTPIKLEVKNTIIDQFSDYNHSGVYKNHIMAYNIVSSGRNNQKILKTPASTVLAFDPETKTVKSMEQNLSNIYADIKIGSLTDSSTIQNNQEKILKTQVQLTDDNLFADTYDAFLKNTELDIVVPGNVSERELYKIITINITEVNKLENTFTEGSPKFSGKYIIRKVTEKFAAGGKYVCKLTINRIDNNDIDNNI